MRKILFSFLILSQLTVAGQRLNFGFGVSFFSLYKTHIKNDIVFGRHSYRAYYVDKNQFSLTSAYQYNFLTSIDYGRYIFTAEIGYYFQQNDGLKTKLSYPIANDQYWNYYSKISYTGYSLNPIISYVISTRHIFKLYGEVGIPFMILNESMVSEKIASERKNGSRYWSDQDEMISELGLTHDYFNLMVGIGYRMSVSSFSIRYINKLNTNADTGSNLGYFTFNISVLTNFSKLKKHYIYIE